MIQMNLRYLMIQHYLKIQKIQNLHKLIQKILKSLLNLKYQMNQNLQMLNQKYRMIQNLHK
jgi:hypothetical protein